MPLQKSRSSRFITVESISSGRSQEFAKGGGTKDGVRQRNPGAEPRWGLGAKHPESNFQLGRVNMHHVPLGYATGLIYSISVDFNQQTALGPNYKKILRLSYDVIITYDNRKSNLR